MHLSSCCGIKLLLFFLTLSAGLLIVSLVLIFKIFPDLIVSEVNKKVKLEESTEQFDRFLELPFPVDFKVYIFHVNNVDGIISNAEKPNLTEIGPYVYKQHRAKTINDTDDEEDSISYTQDLIFEFDAEASGDLSDTDLVTVLNAPMMTMLQTAEAMGMSSLVSSCIKNVFPGYEELFITLPVKNLLFDGINFCKVPFDLCYPINAAACLIAAEKRNVDKLEDNSLSFSFFNYKARENDGLYTILRGLDDITTLGSIIRLDNQTHTEYWGGKNSTLPCDEVKGTDSTLYPPHIEKESVFQIYSTDICRYVGINFIEEGSYKDINGYLFGTNASTLRPSTSIFEDDCFCSHQTRGTDGEESCFLDGVIDMQPCVGVPVLLSFPHFLWADESYGNGVTGLAPDKDKHRIFLLVEPNTGTPLQGMKRIQMNAVLRPITEVTFTNLLPRVVLPLVWVEEGVSLTDEYIDQLNDLYFNKVKIVNIVQWLLLGISTLLVIIFGGMIIKKRC